MGQSILTEPQASAVSRATPSAARAPAHMGAVQPSDEWAQLWFATRERAWSSLAVVPAAVDGAALHVAESLVAAARMFSGAPVNLFDAVGANPGKAAAISEALDVASGRGEQSVVALDCPLVNAAAIHVAREADAVLLLVPLGRARLDEARRVIDVVGRERVIGSLTMQPGRKPKGRARP